MNRDPHGDVTAGLRAYVGRVAMQIGQDVVGFDCDVARLPALAALYLRSRVPTLMDQELLLTWDEVNGWALRAVIDDEGDNTALTYLGDELLAAPQDVASFLRDSRDGRNPGTLYPPLFRDMVTEDDLDTRLACFARRPTQP